ncbi:MAG: sodium ion-translocating decarboxylase subunit beta, partial [Anaerolineae bacterium]
MSLVSLSKLLEGFTSFTWQALVMLLVGGVLIWLAIAKEYEPLLLLPIGLGCILANLPVTGLLDRDPAGNGIGLLSILYDFGIKNELFPSLIFIGIGAMTDFGPLLENPFYALFGAVAQFGIFGTAIIATLFGFSINEAASIGIIGAADGPTSIFVASALAPKLVGPITVAAYSYMSLVPIIQPPVMRLLTTKAERTTRMAYTVRPAARLTRILFPIIVTLVCAL